MYNVLFFIIIVENVYLSAQETEGAFDENLEVVGDITVKRETSVGGEIPAAGNVAFGGHANAKGSIKIFASSEGGSPFLQSTSFSQPFEETCPVFTPYNPAPNLLAPFISPSFLRLNHIPEVFLSTVSYPIYNPYLVTSIRTLDACDLPKTMLPGSIRMKLSTIKSLPKVLIPDVDTDENTVCPIVEPVKYAFMSCPKMVITSPIGIRLFPFRSDINSFLFPLAPLAMNVENVESLQRYSLSITPSLACYPSRDLSIPNAVPINISNSHCNTEPVGEISSIHEFDSVKDCNSKEETSVSNLHFSGIVPVSGSFRIAAKF